MAKHPLTREQEQTKNHADHAEEYEEDLPEKDPADGDGPLTVGEVSPAQNIARQQERPTPAAQTTNPSEESRVSNPQDDAINLSPNEVREQAEKDAQKRAQPPTQNKTSR